MSAQPVSTAPILIVDKEGTLGAALAATVQQTLLTVFVSSRELKEANVISVPFHKKIPRIPDNTFSHIFVVYSGEKELQLALPSFIRKAKETNAQLVLITSLFHYHDSLPEKLFTHWEKAQVIVVGDVFSPLLPPPSTPVTQLLYAAKTTGQVELTQSGLDLLFPIALKDVVEGMMAVGFTVGENRMVYALMPQHPYTQLTFSRILQKLYPLLKVDFKKGKHASIIYHLPTSAVPLLTSNYPLDKRLAELDLTHTPLAGTKRKGKAPKQTFQRALPPRKRRVLLAVSALCFVIALPFLLTIGMALAGGLTLQQTERQLEKGELHTALSSARAASSFFTIADETATTLRAVVSVVGLSHEVVGFQSLIHTGSELSEALTGMLEAGTSIQEMTSGSSEATKDAYIQAINRLKQSMTTLQTIQAEGTLPTAYQERLKRLEQPLTLMINLIDASPSLLGFDKPQTYLVLFQNNFELRPAGGFIGSYGLVKVQKGKMTSFTIHDVYDADGKLTAHVEPPFALKRYLGSSHWFLRDSNYDMDFAKSAAEAVSFLKLETGESVQGVIGIDVTFLTSLLEATGPLYLPDYKETLTKDNFYILTQKHVENNFFPGSTQKKDFLRAAEGELIKRLESRQFSYQKMATILTNAALQKHLLFAFPDKSMQKLFTINNLSSTNEELRTRTPNTFLDTIGVNEANIGLNKSNFYLSRSLGQKVMIDGEGIVTGEMAITYTNTSTKTSEFGGDYKAYVRLLTPAGTTLTDVLIDNTQQTILPAVTDENVYLSKTFKVGKGIEVEERLEQSRKTFGLLLTVPRGQKKTLTFRYRLQNRAPIESQEWTYDLLTIKQPGTLQDAYTLSVTYPLANRLFKSSVPVSDLGSKLLTEAKLTTDRNLRLTFTQR